MNRILITGANGFIGSNLTRKLINSENQIDILTRSNSDLWRINDIMSKCKVHHVDLIKFDDVKSLIDEINPEIVFHCAGHGVYPEQKNSNSVFSTNILGTLNLLLCLKENKKLKRFVNLGSFFEDVRYDKKDSNLTKGLDAYTISKIIQTSLVKKFHVEENLPTITLKIFTPYGRYDSPGRLISDIMISIVKNKSLEINSMTAKRDFIHIDDVIRALEVAGKQKGIEGKMFDVCTGKVISVEEVVKNTKNVIEYNSKILLKDEKIREFDKRDSQIFINSSNNKEFDWRAEISINEGIKKTYEWYKQNIKLYNV
tara:strand:- start:137 stop:1075 length:939 start_codon:yes stop_codon:yes gene_type:complete